MKRKTFDRTTQENHRKLSTSGNNYSNKMSKILEDAEKHVLSQIKDTDTGNKMSKINRWFKKLSHR